MKFVDTNVFMHAVGRPHPLREDARRVFHEAIEQDRILVTSAETLQELLHAYVPVGRLTTLDAALALATARCREIWYVESEDVLLAHSLVDDLPSLSARDLIHVACCRRRGVREMITFDRALAAAMRGS